MFSISYTIKKVRYPFPRLGFALLFCGAVFITVIFMILSSEKASEAQPLAPLPVKEIAPPAPKKQEDSAICFIKVHRP